MIDRATKLRWRRRIKRSRLQVEDYNQSAELNLQKNIFRRLHRLGDVRRFIIGWLTIFILLMAVTIFQIFDLSQYYQSTGYVSGGIFYEGAIGTFTNANPLFANGDVNLTVSRLLFPGLFKYDQNNHLVGDLAESWSVDSLGRNYTVSLKPNLKWQDGKQLTANDVVFTYRTIENPDVQSNLFNNWYGIKVIALNKLTVKFTLPSPLSSFPYELTNGIIPAHIFGAIPPIEMRSSPYDNVDPIGSGPFKLSLLNSENLSNGDPEEQIDLASNSNYYSGQPKLAGFNLIAYANQNDMLNAFEHHNIQAMVGLNNLPLALANDSTVYANYIPITAQTMVFYRNDSALLSDVNIRKAMSLAIDTTKVISQIAYPALPIHGPLLPNMVAYNPIYNQMTNVPKEAAQILDSSGWIMAKDGYRYKNGQQLQFNLYTQDTPEYLRVAGSLINQWRQLGANVELKQFSSIDAKNIIAYKTYDMFLYSISVGVDPDVFAYWDSLQAQPTSIPGLNLSLYKSSTADDSLSAGRTRLDPAERAIKYGPFLQSWQTDYPALALYQPNYLFVYRPKINNFNSNEINTFTDLYSNVSNWQIRQARITNQN